MATPVAPNLRKTTGTFAVPHPKAINPQFNTAAQRTTRSFKPGFTKRGEKQSTPISHDQMQVVNTSITKVFGDSHSTATKLPQMTIARFPALPKRPQLVSKNVRKQRRNRDDLETVLLISPGAQERESVAEILDETASGERNTDR